MPSSAKLCRVLFEKPGRKSGQIVGRTPYLQPVHVEAPRHLIGSIRRCADRSPHGQQPAGAMLV